MSEIVERLRVQREAGYLYFIRRSDVWRAPMKIGRGGPAAGVAEKVKKGTFEREEGYLYFLDKNGDIARAKQRRGRSARAPRGETEPLLDPEDALSLDLASVSVAEVR